MPDINHLIGAGPRTLKSFGDTPVPILFGNDQVSLESGGVLASVYDDDSAITADSQGRKLLRAGTVVIKASGADVWTALKEITDTTGGGEAGDEADGLADEIVAADAVGVLKATADVSAGGGTVGIYIRGGFIAARMPSIADNSAPGLEATAQAALRARGFYFAEDYH